MDYSYVIIAIVLVSIFLVLSFFENSKKSRKYRIKKLRELFGKKSNRVFGDGEYEHIDGFFRNHKEDFVIDEITWHDLNMDEIFSDINYTQSSAGEEYLYYRLKCPSIMCESHDTEERKIEYLYNNEKDRLTLQTALMDCGRTGKYSIYDYIGNLSVLDGENAVADIMIDLLYLLVIIAFFFNTAIAIGLIIFALVLSGLTYFSKKKKIEPFYICFAYVFRVLKGAGLLVKNNYGEVFAEEKNELEKLLKEFNGFKRFSGIMVNNGAGDILSILTDYLKMFFHLDIIKFFHMFGELKKHESDIDKIITIMGRLDFYSSVAMYRAYIKEWCVPTFREGDMELTGIYHPLITEPVKNDIRLNRGMLLTGSNASGKSTMLKTITVNALLAQSINTVCAEAYNAPVYRIYTSLALSDNIFEGESYYMSEIKSLKRIIDCAGDSSSPILACVDEVLRGTNTLERISASCAIMKNLSNVKGIIMAATHDLELADLLKDYYDNYHFEEQVVNNDIVFPYKIIKGKATTRNAIMLLKITGYDSALVDEAMAIAKNYETSGVYSFS